MRCGAVWWMRWMRPCLSNRAPVLSTRDPLATAAQPRCGGGLPQKIDKRVRKKVVAKNRLPTVFNRPRYK